jgi:hypothetical protein
MFYIVSLSGFGCAAELAHKHPRTVSVPNVLLINYISDGAINVLLRRQVEQPSLLTENLTFQSGCRCECVTRAAQALKNAGIAHIERKH